MLKAIIYFSSYFFILAILIQAGLIQRRRAAAVLFVIGVSLIPIGKLFYMPGLSLPSVKASFIYGAMVSLMAVTLLLIKGIEKRVLVPYLFLVPVLLSLIFLCSEAQSSFFSSGTYGENGTILLRVVSIFLTTTFCVYCVDYTANHESAKRDVAKYYVAASVFATVIGGLITYGLFTGQLSAAEVVPVCVQEIHVVGRLFRFNPGANVNEFGQIVGYAILMMRWTGWRWPAKAVLTLVLLAAEVLSLTRGAWVGLVAAYLVYAFFTTAKQRTRLILMGSISVVLLLITINSWDYLAVIFHSRAQLNGGVSGDERIGTAMDALTLLQGSPLRALFGFGWSTEMVGTVENIGLGQIHFVPLNLLFDTGLVGFTIYMLLIAYVFRIIYLHMKDELDIPMSLLTFALVVSLFEHNFFHVQTWLIMGFLIGLALQRANILKRRTVLSKDEWAIGLGGG